MQKHSAKQRKPDQGAALACGSVSTGRFLPRRAELLILVVLVTAAVAFAHWPVLQARARTYDDQMYLTDNPLVQRPSWASAGRFLKEVLAPSTVQGYYQPLTMISLMLDYAVAGSTDNFKPFHTTSLILHLAKTLLIMWLLYALFGRLWIAAAVALLFGVHPMTVEPIAWVGDRKTTLAAFFALWSMLWYIRYARRPSVGTYVLCAALYVLSLMSKPTTTLLPGALLLMDYWPLRRLSVRSVLEKVPLGFIAVISAIITIVSQGNTATVGLPTSGSTVPILLGLCHNIIFYPCKMLWPVHLTSMYAKPDPMSLANPVLLTAVAATIVLVAALLISLRWTRAMLTGALIFFCIILPTMGGIGFTVVIASDKYAYLPTVGLLMILAWLFDSVAGRPVKGKPTWREAVLGVGVLATAGLLAIGTRDYLQEWQTNKRHNFYMLQLAPNSPHVHDDYGNSLADEGDFTGAVNHYNQAIDLAPWHVSAYFNRGYAFERQGNDEQAFHDYSRTITLDPRNPRFARAYSNRGAIYDRHGDHARAIQDFNQAIESNAEYAEAYANRGSAYKHMGDYTKAIRDFTRAIEIKPDLVEAYNNRGNMYLAARQFARAIPDYTRAIELQPDFPEAYNNRGNAYNELRDFDRAIQDYAKAIELRPAYAEAYANRADAHTDMGDLNQAIRGYSKAIELRPDYANAYYKRAVLYYKLQRFDQAWADLQKCQKAGGQPSPEVVRALSEAAGHSMAESQE